MSVQECSYPDEPHLLFDSPVPDIVIGLIITALFMYPHIGFIIEVRRGIMTRETYSREEHSCCCVSTFA